MNAAKNCTSLEKRPSTTNIFLFTNKFVVYKHSNFLFQNIMMVLFFNIEKLILSLYKLNTHNGIK